MMLSGINMLIMIPCKITSIVLHKLNNKVQLGDIGAALMELL